MQPLTQQTEYEGELIYGAESPDRLACSESHQYLY